jgi:drug/metabolite transporter (DMT)-like permease
MLIGVVLIAVGIFLLVRGWSYTSEQGTLQIGEFKAMVEEKRTLPPWVGGAAIVAGVLLLTAGRRRRSAA